ncbi:MAG: benzoyl-CoA 2,3-epoxidase subunit BoxB, partial [Pseudomonadota bacterium]
YPVLKMHDGTPTLVDEPALSAINMRLRDDYTRDVASGLRRWNRIIDKAGVSFELALPSAAFNRQIGEFRDVEATPEGQIIGAEEWTASRDAWLPSKADGDFIESLMAPEWEPGRYASWIAPPKVGIDNRPGDFEYVQLHLA